MVQPLSVSFRVICSNRHPREDGDCLFFVILFEWWPENENYDGEKGNKDCGDDYCQRINIGIDHSF